MTVRPIFFSAPMVRALLDGTKTQTRRVLRLPVWASEIDEAAGEVCSLIVRKTGCTATWSPPYSVGDLLYVRERCRADERDGGWDGVRYLADHAWIPIDNTAAAAERWVALNHYGRKRGDPVPGVHAPRWTSRLTLDVTDVRVQRLQQISEEDAIAEGCRPFFDEANPEIVTGPNGTEHRMAPLRGPLDDFHRLWDLLNEARGYGWEANPWVVAVTFTLDRQNVDSRGEGRAS